MVTDSRMELHLDGVREELGEVGRWLSAAAADGTAALEVERTLFRKLLELAAATEVNWAWSATWP